MNIACSICLESFILTSGIHTTRCGHVFHYECIRKWLESEIQQIGIQHCPQCREKCAINQITRLCFSENDSALEENNVGTQLQSENLRLQQEVIALKSREVEANQKYVDKLLNQDLLDQIQENMNLLKEVNALKARELKSWKERVDLEEEKNNLHKSFMEIRSNCAQMDRVLKEQRKEISELKAKYNQNEEESGKNGYDDSKANEKKTASCVNKTKITKTAKSEINLASSLTAMKISNSISDSGNETSNSGQAKASTSQSKEKILHKESK